MPTELDPYRCPAEDAIEIWAIQDVLGVPYNDERLHLINCPLCHELHTRFVDFYCTIPRDAPACLVAKQPGSTNSTPVLEHPVKTTHRYLRLLDRFDEGPGSSRPIAISHHLLSGPANGNGPRNSFISADGTIVGKFFEPNGKRDWSFHLLSTDMSYVERTAFRLNGGRAYFQSDDTGTSILSMGNHTPSDIESIELVPFIAETVFDPFAHTSARGRIPEIIRVDAGPAGEIILEQEEGDRGEAILHLLLTGMPKPFLEKRILVALENDDYPPLVEEAVGRDLYYYGVDLFRKFGLWIYLR